ncbi:hypothetical protein [Streptomyces sp. NBC_01373]|uniref:hypothetical protein n=1 Tax=Streptomyces sp. NBC_01373 TaxID=2903843 RepID=UPI00224E8409|nr:hypothetical protein [Streptomyces sp. NBC_01373]MCX4704124.1 hypothetical protein [Streptomyces sp. NBC_01373]
MTASEYSYEYEKQRTAQLALGRLLTRATKTGLRPLSWTVSPHGVLIGEESGSQRRADLEQLFEQWAAFFGDDLVREDDDLFTSNSDVKAHTNNAPGAGKDVTVRLRITVTSDWEQHL